MTHCRNRSKTGIEEFTKPAQMSGGWDEPYGGQQQQQGWASQPNYFDPNASGGFGNEQQHFGNEQQHFGNEQQHFGNEQQHFGNEQQHFGNEQQHFQSFDYSAPAHAEQYSCVAYPVAGSPSMFVPEPVGEEPLGGTLGDEEEPPLLEELGIHPEAILQKTLNVLNPRRSTDPAMLQDTDLAGPLVFCLAFGSFLLLAGKLQFGAIYGVGLLGCIALYGLLNVMSTNGVGLGVVISVLGYCLLPIVGLAGLNVLVSLQGVLGAVLAGFTILWCSWSASKLFITALSMHHQQPLVAYPCALVYSVFALITVF